jgi:hypothetical protein
LIAVVIGECDLDRAVEQFGVAEGRRVMLAQSYQILSGGCEGEGPSNAVAVTEAGLVLAGNHLDPAKRFLNALADTLANGITAMRLLLFADRSRSRRILPRPFAFQVAYVTAMCTLWAMMASSATLSRSVFGRVFVWLRGCSCHFSRSTIDHRTRQLLYLEPRNPVRYGRRRAS